MKQIQSSKRAQKALQLLRRIRFRPMIKG